VTEGRKRLTLVTAIAVLATLVAAALIRVKETAPDAVAASGEGGFAAAMRGRTLFAENCARCHGDTAQGAENWHIPDAQGRYPAPPLNGTAHAWHHPREQLERVIANGGVTMPAFGGRLNEQQIADLVTYITSLWPDEIYEAWQHAQERRKQ